MSCGVYQIVNIKNNNRYIGSSINIEDRFYAHKHGLRCGKHHNNLQDQLFTTSVIKQQVELESYQMMRVNELPMQ